LRKAEMSPEGVLHYYDKWSENGRYDKVSNNYFKFYGQIYKNNNINPPNLKILLHLQGSIVDK